MKYNALTEKNELIVYNELGELFAKHNSDKHHLDYHTWYDKFLPKQAGDFLEIGTWKGGGIFSFKEWYKGIGNFFAMNYVFGGEIIEKEVLIENGITPYEGNQSDLEFLATITQKFDIIIDDGSHHSDEQIITLKHLFKNNLRDGGLYIVEDLHCCTQEYWWRIITDYKHTLLAVVKEVLSGGPFKSQLIDDDEDKYFCDNITRIELPSKSIVFIWKGDNTNGYNKWGLRKLLKFKRNADTIQRPVRKVRNKGL